MAFRPERLRERREKSDLSQHELGEALGTKQQAISMYEKGTRRPDHDTLTRLADVLDTSTDYLLGRIDYPERLSDRDFQVIDAFRRYDIDEIERLAREHLVQKGLAKRGISRRKPPLA